MSKIILSLSILLACIISASAQNTVSFDNQSGEPALVKLIGSTSTEIQVPDGTKQAVQASAGKYFIKVRYGVEGKYHYTKGQEFTVDETATTTSTITITLHRVVNGNYDSSPITEQEFGVGNLIIAPAQQSDADRNLFEDTKLKAEKGNAQSQRELGRIYEAGLHGVTRDMTEAVKWFRKAAEQNDPEAQYNLGFCYADNVAVSLINFVVPNTSGKGVVKDKVETVKWFRKAAEQNYAKAQFILGVCYEDGEGVAKDYAEAVKWYHRAAEQNYALDQFKLFYYYSDEGAAKDEVEAYKWWLLGNAEAKKTTAKLAKLTKSQVFIVTPTLRKELSPEQFAEGKRRADNWLKQHNGQASNAQTNNATREQYQEYMVKAEKGDAKAQFTLGNCYYLGQGVTKDYVEAVKWYRKAAEQNNADAQANLGLCYYNGDGVAKDQVEAVKWYHQAAEQNNAQAQFTLGLCCGKGKGVVKDQLEAVKWYRKAAEQNNADAQYNLGLCYYHGEGVAKDLVEAVKWIHKAAEQNDAEAQIDLGHCYFEGEGVAKNQSEAVEWFRKAAEQNNAKAQHSLGVCYDNGVGVAQDDAEAVKWYHKAAQQNNADAQLNLGVCYFKGQGVTKDYVKGYKWINLAAAQGDESAKRDLTIIERSMTAEQIAEGKRLAREFTPGE